MVAYATRITERNMQAIASEKPDFDLEQTRAWLAIHGSGYFLCDPDSAFNYQYFDTDVFVEMYQITNESPEALFVRVEPK